MLSLSKHEQSEAPSSNSDILREGGNHGEEPPGGCPTLAVVVDSVARATHGDKAPFKLQIQRLLRAFGADLQFKENGLARRD